MIIKIMIYLIFLDIRKPVFFLISFIIRTEHILHIGGLYEGPDFKALILLHSCRIKNNVP